MHVSFYSQPPLADWSEEDGSMKSKFFQALIHLEVYKDQFSLPTSLAF